MEISCCAVVGLPLALDYNLSLSYKLSLDCKPSLDYTLHGTTP